MAVDCISTKDMVTILRGSKTCTVYEKSHDLYSLYNNFVILSLDSGGGGGGLVSRTFLSFAVNKSGTSQKCMK